MRGWRERRAGEKVQGAKAGAGKAARGADFVKAL
jgi:hypothetical protein